jgi:hypothetical protein
VSSSVQQASGGAGAGGAISLIFSLWLMMMMIEYTYIGK